MLRTVIIFRHAKSDWDSEYSHDRERPLARRGSEAARAMGRLLSAAGLVPDMVISSPAVRAAATVDLAIIAGDWPCTRETNESLYQCGASEMLHALRGLPNSVERVLLAGHETSCSETVSRLIGGGDIRIPTGSMACISLELKNWKDCAWGDGELSWLVPPRMLTEGPRPLFRDPRVQDDSPRRSK